MPSAAEPSAHSRQRVTAAERRDALIDAAIKEFAVTGLHGTPVERIARRVGVAQPYVFSLFQTKRELFIAAFERCFERVGDVFTQAVQATQPVSPAGGQATSAATDGGHDHPGDPALRAMASSYVQMLRSDRSMLMLQLQSYAACDDAVIRQHVREAYESLRQRIRALSSCDDEELHRFMSSGLYLTAQAAMGATDRIEALSEELRTAWLKEPQVKE